MGTDAPETSEMRVTVQIIALTTRNFKECYRDRTIFELLPIGAFRGKIMLRFPLKFFNIKAMFLLTDKKSFLAQHLTPSRNPEELFSVIPCPVEEWIHPNDYTTVLKWAYILSQMSLILQSRKKHSGYLQCAQERKNSDFRGQEVSPVSTPLIPQKANKS